MDNSDLEAAVRSGVVSADVADRLRNFSAKRRSAPEADEERLNLVSGIADVMSAIGIFMFVGAAFLALTLITPLAAAWVAPICWLLAEYFTRRRKQALTSFLIYGGFVIASGLAVVAVAFMLPFGGSAIQFDTRPTPEPVSLVQALIIAAGMMACSMAWWVRFRLPIAYAAAWVAGVNVATHVIRLCFPDASEAFVGFYLLGAGISLLAVAVWWDITDIRRETYRTDVAFWLHAAAGFAIAGASYRLLFGLQRQTDGWDRLYNFATLDPGISAAIAGLLLFAVFLCVALVIDRRALLMSSLGFAIPAAAKLFSSLSPAIAPFAAAMGIGTVLILLAFGWLSMRKALLALLPTTLRAQLPRTAIENFSSRPVR